MQANFDLSVVSIIVTVTMAVLQMAVLVWKGGELNQRVKHLEAKADRMDSDIASLKLDVGELKSEFRADIAFIKGVLSGWKNNHPSQNT